MGVHLRAASGRKLTGGHSPPSLPTQKEFQIETFKLGRNEMEMIDQEKEVLTVRKSYGSTETVEVVDSNGIEIHKGDFIRCIVTTHSWLKLGDLAIVTGASSGGLAPGLHYQDIHGSSSGILSTWVERVDTTPELRKEFERSYLYHRLGQVNEQISNQLARRAAIQARIDFLDN